MFSIGDVAQRAGVKVPTIRYYEEQGLIAAPGRSQGNQRRYDRATLDRLAFIRHARELGLSIEAIRQLLELSDHPERPCANADRIASDQLAAVRRRIDSLRRLERELERIASGCHADTAGECYVIEALSHHEWCDSDHPAEGVRTERPGMA